MLEKGGLVGSCSSAIPFRRRLWVSGTRLRKFVSNPTRFTTGPRYIERNSVCQSTRGKNEAIIKMADMDQTLAESSYDMAVTSRSNTGTANSQEIQIAMEKSALSRNSTMLP